MGRLLPGRPGLAGQTAEIGLSTAGGLALVAPKSMLAIGLKVKADGGVHGVSRCGPLGRDRPNNDRRLAQPEQDSEHLSGSAGYFRRHSGCLARRKSTETADTLKASSSIAEA